MTHLASFHIAMAKRNYIAMLKLKRGRKCSPTIVCLEGAQGREVRIGSEGNVCYFLGGETAFRMWAVSYICLFGLILVVGYKGNLILYLVLKDI